MDDEIESRCNEVEFAPAFVWMCPTCLTESFTAAMDAELSEEEREEAERMGLSCDLFVLPNEITCTNCFETFEVEL